MSCIKATTPAVEELTRDELGELDTGTLLIDSDGDLYVTADKDGDTVVVLFVDGGYPEVHGLDFMDGMEPKLAPFGSRVTITTDSSEHPDA